MESRRDQKRNSLEKRSKNDMNSADRSARRRKREQEVKRNRILLIAVTLVLVVAGTLGIKASVKSHKLKREQQAAETRQKEDAAKKAAQDKKALLQEADRIAAGYDYDRAVKMLKEQKDFEKDKEYTAAAAKYEEEKSKLVEYSNVEEITHIFFHTLIVDTSKAFDGDYKQDDYNQVMTTVDEFNKILQQMYDKGYVLISIRDMVEETTGEDGTTQFSPGKIMLPEGKIPFVMSQDDVSYYEYMDGDGYASRLVIGEDGRPQNEMKLEDGSTVTGDYDVVPLTEAFIEKHPDFSYRGARGILALTGYNGVLGYRTDPDYADDGKKATGTYEEDCRKAGEVAQGLRDRGWEFASHSYGHLSYENISFDKLKADADKWQETVASIIGPTDILIYPFGDDIGGVKEYSGEKYEYLKSQGFRFFCNVDSHRYWVQLTKDYLRQGRRNLDGVRMYYDMINDKSDKLSDLFDVKEVFDKNRPTPVPKME